MQKRQGVAKVLLLNLTPGLCTLYSTYISPPADLCDGLMINTVCFGYYGLLHFNTV